VDKTILKNFAIDARNKLIKDIKNKASMIGITEKGILDSHPESNSDMKAFNIGTTETYRIYNGEVEQYNKLVEKLRKRANNSNYKTAYNSLIEEVAYTWFNRLIALRFMEVNDYLPDRMRILSSGRKGVNEPEVVTNYLDTSLEFTDEELEQLETWKADGSALAMEKLFHLLFIKQCNALNENLPELFEKTNDYAELLLTISYNDPDGVLYKLVHDVPEEYFSIESEDGNGQVEIIGWLYQYYNTERKDEVFARPRSAKIQKEDIPAATQLFTPDWIVRYMVENSLGRLWIEKLVASGDTRSKKEISEEFGWKYYIPEAEQNNEVKEQLIEIREDRKNIQLEDIRFIDPAMGSFHIGIYAFDVFMQLYETQGYTAREAAKIVIEKNLFGLDIDKRAYQLSYFACMMKGRQYNRRILNKEIICNLYTIPESNKVNRSHIDYLGCNIPDNAVSKKRKEDILEILDIFIDAKEYGSILEITKEYDFSTLRRFVSDVPKEQISIGTVDIERTQKEILEILSVAEILSEKYDVVVTNPPYMGGSGMNPKLSRFVRENYPDSKSDLFAVFMERCESFTKGNRYYAMITQHSWMFLSSYEKLRETLQKQNIVNMVHLGPRAFEEIGGEVVQTTSFVFRNSLVSSYNGSYVRLINFNNAEEKELKTLEAIDNPNCGYYYKTSQDNFEKIPGRPVAYWVSSNLIEAFEEGKPMNSLVNPRQGLATADNNRFLRMWYEVDYNKISFASHSIKSSVESKAKWFPYNKGGARRQWYGNYDYVVNWENDGFEIRNFKDDKGRQRSVIRNPKYYFKESVTWSLITSGGFSIRYREAGSIHDVSGMSAFTNNHEKLMYILGLMSTKIANYVFKILNPTINLQIGDFNNFPVLLSDNKQIFSLGEENILVAKDEWNSFEEAWGFKIHPFLTEGDFSTIKESYNSWEKKCKNRILKTKNNEEELNRIFIKLYRLENELSSDVDIKDITLRKADLNRDIKSFISYAVGCMFGRYSLDVEGLAYAGGEWDDSKYRSFIPAKDNIILITDEEYFSDDVVGRFVEFLRACYGEETLEENLAFISDALGGNGTPREIIRNYFVKDFYKDHVRTYQKRLIYWLYDSGRQNGFKALIYMHRYNEDTTGKLRVDYLHEMQKAYEGVIDYLNNDIAQNKNAREVAASQKRLEKVTKQLKECTDYDERVAHMALARIAIDLDDGVKVNYDKVQTDEEGNNLQILAKIR
jgi:hypothetical protein